VRHDEGPKLAVDRPQALGDVLDVSSAMIEACSTLSFSRAISARRADFVRSVPRDV